MKKEYQLGLSISCILITIAMLTSSFVFAQNVVLNNQIYDNVYIEDINVSLMTKKEATDTLKNLCYNKKYVLKYGDFVFNYQKEDFGLKLDVKSTVDKAYSIGRQGSYIDRILKIIDLKKGQSEKIKFEYEYDDVKIEKIIKEISSQINKEPKDAYLYFEGKDIKFFNDINGVYVDEEKTKKLIISYITGCKNDIIEVAVIEKEPNIKIDDINHINTLLGEYETKFNPNVWGRTKNIELASSKMDGMILKSGDVFSFNTVTGQRGISGGYKLAPVIIEGELKDSIGGGICQVSSTLYNAVLNSGLEIVERKNHTIPSSYIKIGLDATVVQNYVDFKFKNNNNNAIYLFVKPQNGKMIARVYGEASDRKDIRTYSVINKVIPMPIKTIEDLNLELGKKIIEKKGRKGYKVTSFRQYMKDGKVLSTEFLSKSYYPPKTQIVKIGVKNN
ncbi:VanW family protein [Peptostreptococcaceae bacterium AGR-M142]